MDSSPDVDQLLADLRHGDLVAAEKLFPLLYEELRKLAARIMRRDRPDDLLDPTALVHEAYIKLVQKPSPRWEDRSHFFAVAAQSMRQVLVDHARERSAQKRGGTLKRVELSAAMRFAASEVEGLIAVDEALKRLAEVNSRQSQVVELRMFAGLTLRETAGVLGVAESTVKNDWSMARTWLQRELSEHPTPPHASEPTSRHRDPLPAELRVIFEADVTPAAMKATLKALADYFRMCGGLGLPLDQDGIQSSH